MMSSVIRQETVVFLVSVLHGIGLAFLYDLLRALRRAVPHGLFAVSAEDFLYWVAAGFLTFCLAFLRTDGVIRGYVAAGIAIGAVLYHVSASTLVLRSFTGLFTLARRGIAGAFSLLRRIFWCLLGNPVRKIWCFLKKTIEFRKKRRYNESSKENKHGKVRGERCGKKEETSEQRQP